MDQEVSHYRNELRFLGFHLSTRPLRIHSSHRQRSLAIDRLHYRHDAIGGQAQHRPKVHRALRSQRSHGCIIIT